MPELRKRHSGLVRRKEILLPGMLPGRNEKARTGKDARKAEPRTKMRDLRRTFCSCQRQRMDLLEPVPGNRLRGRGVYQNHQTGKRTAAGYAADRGKDLQGQTGSDAQSTVDLLDRTGIWKIRRDHPKRRSQRSENNKTPLKKSGERFCKLIWTRLRAEFGVRANVARSIFRSSFCGCTPGIPVDR